MVSAGKAVGVATAAEGEEAAVKAPSGSSEASAAVEGGFARKEKTEMGIIDRSEAMRSAVAAEGGGVVVEALRGSSSGKA